MDIVKRTIGGHKMIQGGLATFILCHWIVDRDVIIKNKPVLGYAGIQKCVS